MIATTTVVTIKAIANLAMASDIVSISILKK